MLTNQNQELAEFIVHDAQYVPAQVKIVKCIVQNIAVDISFNQVAGLSSLCFLEKVDLHIGKDHLFKRSIILIKAWCFYESRILGAQYGLISTYALEILVLYIINVFHSSLDSPLAVLYKFLEYYSTFDWEHHCISLNGPVFVKSLPRIVAVTPEASRSNLLLKEEFLESHVKYFSVRQRAFKTGGGAFPIKHLNIIDPLKGNNNLGRSVRKANFSRIISALAYGCGKLREILILPRKDIVVQLMKFFMNTLERNRSVPRLDAEVPFREYRSQRSEICSLNGDYGKSFTDLICGHLYYRRCGCNFIEPSYPILYFLSMFEQHFSQYVLYPGSANSFVQTFRHKDILLMYYSVMGVDDIADFQVTSTNRNSVNVEEKLALRIGATYSVNTTFEKSKSRGTGTFIPYSAVQEKMTSNTSYYDMSAHERLKLHSSGTYEPDIDIEGKSTLQGRGSQYFKLGGTNTYIPGFLVEGKAESQESQTTAMNTGLKEGASTSGNDTCSPDAHNSCRSMHVPEGARDMELKHPVLPLQSSIGAEHLDVSSESDKDGKHSCFDLSMENFPLLPSTTKANLSKNRKSIQPSIESQPAWKPLPCIKTESATSAPPSTSLVLSVPVAMKQSEDVVSTPVQSALDVPIVAAEESAGSSENNNEVLVQLYQLDDDKDFPLLRR